MPPLPPPHPIDPDGAEPFATPTLSTWPLAVHGPRPFPGWVITSADAVDTDLGMLKSGKEADVHLVERRLDAPGQPVRAALVAAKRYRSGEHRMFHRDAGYLEGRRVRRSRETRAMARRTHFGRELLAGQWAESEFRALCRLWELTHSPGGSDGRPTALVPYPVQLIGQELLLEFLGDDDGHAAPRLVQTRPGPEELVDYWHQTLDALGTLALAGLAHGDLSPYNVLVHRGRLVLIDLPQVVDVVANPQGPGYLARDVTTMTRWFLGRGLPEQQCDVEQITADLLADAGLRADPPTRSCSAADCSCSAAAAPRG